MTGDAPGNELVVRRPQGVQSRGQVSKRHHVVEFVLLIRHEGHHRGEGGQCVIGCLRHGAIGSSLIAVAVDEDHLAVEILEGAESGVAVLAQIADGDGTLIEPLHQGARRGYLEHRVMRDVEGLSQRRLDEGADALPTAGGTVMEHLPEGVGDHGVESMGHGGTLGGRRIRIQPGARAGGGRFASVRFWT